MYTHDKPRHVRVGTVNSKELAALLAVLKPYRAEPITPTVIELATRLARLECKESAL
jgi:hypothetical protein